MLLQGIISVKMTAAGISQKIIVIF